MTEAESKIIELLERINRQLSTISEDVAYVVSCERAREEQRHEEIEKLLEQSRIGLPPRKE
jgi:predicted transcriptional regulator